MTETKATPVIRRKLSEALHVDLEGSAVPEVRTTWRRAARGILSGLTRGLEDRQWSYP
jgi:hypothetical protein